MSPSSRHRWLAGAASLAAHVGVFLLLISSVRPPADLPPPPVLVQLVAPPPPPQPPAPAPRPKASAAPVAAARPATPTRDTRRAAVRPVPIDIPTRPVEAATAPKASGGGVSGAGLSDSELAGAAVAGSGAPGGACDMARQIQAALRKDPLVQAAMAEAVRGAGGRAIMVWNGDWVQNNGEDGKGLAAVREAIMWEVAFAPPACRAEPVRGLVLMSLNGSTRLALGERQWRWSDLLGRR
jgi:hypothetical protein